jgi:acyl carrier protein
METLTPESIAGVIVDYVLANYISEYTVETIPLDQSLVVLGVMDSYGVVELVSFLEDTWGIRIADAEITREKMGSITKMARLVCDKVAAMHRVGVPALDERGYGVTGILRVGQNEDIR